MCETKHLNKQIATFCKYLEKLFLIKNNSRNFHPYRNGVLMLNYNFIYIL